MFAPPILAEATNRSTAPFSISASFLLPFFLRAFFSWALRHLRHRAWNPSLDLCQLAGVSS